MRVQKITVVKTCRQQRLMGKGSYVLLLTQIATTDKFIAMYVFQTGNGKVQTATNYLQYQ